VIASVHSGLEMSRKKMMNRFRRAIEHPATRMIGHPTGRLLLRREGSDLDMETLLEWAAEANVVIEINANPRRLDLDWRYGRRAREVSLLTSVNPDAHTVEGIDDIDYGVRIARKGLFDAPRVVNSWPADRFEAWLAGQQL
jgi:DNA polymerase (family X)